MHKRYVQGREVLGFASIAHYGAWPLCRVYARDPRKGYTILPELKGHWFNPASAPDWMKRELRCHVLRTKLMRV